MTRAEGGLAMIAKNSSMPTIGTIARMKMEMKGRVHLKNRLAMTPEGHVTM